MLKIPCKTKNNLEEPMDLRKESAIKRESHHCSVPCPIERWERLLFTPFFSPYLLWKDISIEAQSDQRYAESPVITTEKMDTRRFCTLHRSLSCSETSNSSFFQKTRHRSASDALDSNRSISSTNLNFNQPIGEQILKKPSRGLTGKHIKYGTGARIETLLTLRQKIVSRKRKADEMDVEFHCFDRSQNRNEETNK